MSPKRTGNTTREKFEWAVFWLLVFTLLVAVLIDGDWSHRQNADTSGGPVTTGSPHPLSSTPH